MISKIKKVSILGMLSLFFVALATPITSIAQNSPSGNGLLISPTRTELTGNPGESKDFSISVKNITGAALFAKAYTNDFESDGKTGTPKIITDPQNKSPYSISDMVKGLEDFELKSDESKTVNLSIDIPDGVAPGAYFGIVRYAALPIDQKDNAEQRQIALTASVGHLVFLTVPGEVNEQISLDALNISTDSGASQSIFTKKPNQATLTVRNLGNGLSHPFGSISLYSPSNKQINKYDINNEDVKALLLPNSTRDFAVNIDGISMPGRYKAVASMAYGNGGEVVNYTTTFWYMPLWFLAIIAVVIIGLIVLGWVIYRKVSQKASK